MVFIPLTVNRANTLSAKESINWNRTSATEAGVKMVSKNDVHQNVDSEMLRFGQSLNPPERFHEEGRRLSQHVFVKLMQLLPKEFSAAQSRFAGSVGKATDVIEPDLDLYLVVNSRLPPFDQVLDVMENTLQQHQVELEIQEGSIKHSGHKPRVSMQFSFRNGMDVDLLPAANIDSAQVLLEIAKDPEKNYYIYNPSLISEQLAFMKSHDSFTHSLIRLSKFWIKSLSFGDKKFNGGSTIMELIGCAAAEEEQMSCQKPSMLRALTRVVQMVSEIDTLKLAFEPVSSQIRKKTWWRRVPLSELKPSSPFLIPGIIGTKEVLKRKCFIIEPANPYYDHLHMKDPALILMLKNFAFETKRRLTGIMMEVFLPTNKIAVDFVKIFEPQPINLKMSYSALNFPNDFCIGCEFPSTAPFFPSTNVRKDDVLQKKEIRFVIDALKWNLVSLVHSTLHISSSGEAKLSDVQTNVEDLIKASFSLVEIPSRARLDRHDQMDVTVSIPYNCQNSMQTVKFSMTWVQGK